MPLVNHKEPTKAIIMRLSRIILSIIVTVIIPLTASAQVSIGYYSNNKVLASLAEYRQAMADVEQLRAQYERETQRAEKEFNTKYEEFLDNVTTLAPSIRRKRQAELQQTMESNVRFREEARRLLKQAEADAVQPVQQRINDTPRAVAAEQSLELIVNTDSNACPFISPNIGKDITNVVIEAMRR